MACLPYLERGLKRPERVAIRDASGAWTYRELAAAAAVVAARLGPLEGERVAFLLPRAKESVAVLLGILEAGGIAVPFSTRGAPRELAYQLSDAGALKIVVGRAFEPILAKTLPLAEAQGIRPAVVAAGILLEGKESGMTGVPRREDPALILYTSGTTGQPKGVVHTHESLTAQVDVLFKAWGWNDEDRLLHVLPLHHIHGLVNGVLGALWAGAELALEEQFDPLKVWEAFAQDRATVFFAVPTMYHQLVEAWERQDAEGRRRWADGAGRLRLAVSGSAALLMPLWRRWWELTGQALLERYGMTEIGMAVSNPYRGERRAGTVGQPLPGVEVRIVTEEGKDAPAGAPGEIWARGRSLFKEYWNRPEATREAFRDGYFRTGDIAETVEGYVRILGRASVDILKSAGYKISALEVEEVVAGHPAVGEVAVVGVPDPQWGEVVTACVILRPGRRLSLEELRQWCQDQLASYKVPRRLVLRGELPRNALGKVTKPDLLRQLSGGPS